MIIDDVHRGITKRRKHKRLGRGTGSGHGKTAGRGHKGAGSRRGYSARVGFAGGQMPLFRLVAKRGFNNNAFADKIIAINISTLEKHFESGAEINPITLSEEGLAKAKHDFIKILGDGELTKKFTLSGVKVSKGAAEKIQAAGGSVQTEEAAS